MFDAGQGGGSGCVNQDGPDEDRSPRRQYTLKGVEAETIELMREAAGQEGMKIGAWVSLRMKQAAERALGRIEAEKPRRVTEQLGQATSVTMEDLSFLVRCQQEEADARLLRLEREMHELISGQRSILSALLDLKHS